MTWTNVEGECNCPHKPMRRWTCSTNPKMVGSLERAKETIRVQVRQHVDASENCSLDNVTITIYHEEKIREPKK